jgi:hypothetical protein
LELRKEIFRLLGNKCVRCGFADPRVLQIDHIHGHGTQERKKQTNNACYYRLILNKIKNGSKDYQLLCANCNWLKRLEQNEEGKPL